MKIIINSSKTLNFKSKTSLSCQGDLIFPRQVMILNKYLYSLTKEDLVKMMKISERLADENFYYNQRRYLKQSESQAKAAIAAFSGTFFEALDFESLDNKTLDFAKQHLFILSGLYGILKPLDPILPYRLEMATQIQLKTVKNLYDFWREVINKYLLQNLRKDELIINLASIEYSKVINYKQFNMVNIKFKEYKNNQFKSNSAYSKKARGLFCRFILEKQIKTVEDLKSFNQENYNLNETISNNQELIFTR